jgi:hypothetical protein
LWKKTRKAAATAAALHILFRFFVDVLLLLRGVVCLITVIEVTTYTLMASRCDTVHNM